MSQVKFKIGFTINSEALIHAIGKFLPIEDLEVEELVPRRIEPASKPKLLGDHKPKRQVRRRASPGPDLKKGINMVIVNELEKEPKRALELQPKVMAAGFSGNSVNSRLESLRSAGVVERIGDGRWQMKSNVP
jgi:hypothetical protein